MWYQSLFSTLFKRWFCRVIVCPASDVATSFAAFPSVGWGWGAQIRHSVSDIHFSMSITRSEIFGNR